MSVAGRLRQMLARPEFVTDLLQILKTVVAATGAWWLSVTVLKSPTPFLAPWTALLTVHATVFRSLSRGIQTMIASGAGVAMSFVIGEYLGVSLWTFALALFIGLAGSRVSWFREEGAAVATTAIFILGSGFSSQEPFLDNRLFEVGIGVGAGLLINFALIPPLRDRQAARYVDHINQRMGHVLLDIADQFASSWDTEQADAWIDETVNLDNELRSAWQSVWSARQSGRVNLRRHVPAPRWPQKWQGRQLPTDRQQASYAEILTRVREGITHLQHLSRTLREAADTDTGTGWDLDFCQQWATIARDTGYTIADPDADVEPLHDRINSLVTNLTGRTSPPDMHWPLYGSLITSIRHIIVIVDDVASAREARDPSAT